MQKYQKIMNEESSILNHDKPKNNNKPLNHDIPLNQDTPFNYDQPYDHLHQQPSHQPYDHLHQQPHHQPPHQHDQPYDQPHHQPPERLLDHEKLDVYHVAVDFVMVADKIIEHLPRGRGYLSDQLQRAALSISLNIAEGVGEYSIDEKIRFYRMAKRSATECAGILTVCQRLQLVEERYYRKGRELLIRLVSMLIKMARKSR